jgi:threonine dehydratase
MTGAAPPGTPDGLAEPVALPTRAAVESAAARLGEKIRHTPVVTLHGEELGVPARVLLKLELLQHTGSFKARGALNSVMSLSGADAVAAASGGNHGAAVAWAAQRSGVRADVFAPASATPAKLDRIREYGAGLHLVDGDVGDALDACHAFSEEHGVPVVHPYDTWETVCGAGTMGLEIADQVPDAELVLVGCGGGGLYTGVTAALSTGGATVQPVETELCPHLHDALAAGRPVPRASGGAAADSLGPPQVGRLGFATAVAAGADSVLVSEEDLARARALLWQRLRVLAEPGACAPLAALVSGRVRVHPGSTVVVAVSGGNNPTIP